MSLCYKHVETEHFSKFYVRYYIWLVLDVCPRSGFEYWARMLPATSMAIDNGKNPVTSTS